MPKPHREFVERVFAKTPDFIPGVRRPAWSAEAMTARAMAEYSALQKPCELERFLEVVRKHGQPMKTIVEIGTAAGGTLSCFIELAGPDSTVISVDKPGGDFGGGYRLRDEVQFAAKLKHPGQKLHFVRQDSHDDETLQRVERLLRGQKADLLIIDGDHSAQGVKQDLIWYSELVKPGGLIGVHDIVRHPPSTGCEVYTVWENWAKHYWETEEIIDPYDHEPWGGIGIAFIPLEFGSPDLRPLWHKYEPGSGRVPESEENPPSDER